MKIFLRLIKLIVVPLLIAIGIYSFIRFVWIPNSEEEKEFRFIQIGLEEYQQIFVDKEECLVFVTKEDSEKKSDFEQIIRDKFKSKSLNVYYLDISNFEKEKLTSFEDLTGLDHKQKYKLPILIYSINGAIYDSLDGYKESHYVEDFINRNNIQ